MKVEAAPFDAADYLSDEETIAEYLTAALSVYQKPAHADAIYNWDS